MEVLYWIIAVLIVMISGGLSLFYQTMRETSKIEDEETDKEEKKTIKLKKKNFVFQSAVCIAAIILFYILRDNKTNIVESYMNIAVFLWLYPIAVIDYKEKIIPNKLILVGFAGWIIYFAACVFINGNNIISTAKLSLGGLAFGAGVFLVSALIVRGGVGMGDVKLFAVLGMLFGFSGVFTILFFTLIMLFIVGIVMLIIKKANKKSTFPMAPFVLFGLMLTILL